MAFADFAQTENAIRSISRPALLAAFVGARALNRHVDFMYEKDVCKLLEAPVRSDGIFVDNHLLLVHELQNVRHRGHYSSSSPCTRTNLVRASLELTWGQYVYVRTPGYGIQELVIPSADLLSEFFSGNRSGRCERTIQIPLEPGAPSCFPFHKYQNGWGNIPAQAQLQ